MFFPYYSSNEGIKNHNVEHCNTPIFLVVGLLVVWVASKIYWGTTALFHYDNGPPTRVLFFYKLHV